MTLALEGTPVHFTGSGSSFSFSSFTTSNPAEIFVVVLSNGASVSSISGGSLTWARRQTTSGTNPLEEWAAQATGALSAVTISVTMSGSAGFLTADLFAFSGQDTSTIWDSHAGIPAHNDAFIADPVSISTTNANDVIVASFRMNSQSTPTQGSGFTKISGANFLLTEYQIVSAAQTNLSCTIGTGVSDSNGAIADALMASSATGIPPGLGPVVQMEQMFHLDASMMR